MESVTGKKRAILDLEGATCVSCSIAVEHAGRRIPGVTDIYVDRGTSTIQVEYDGEPGVLDSICDIVDRLGYGATVRATG